LTVKAPSDNSDTATGLATFNVSAVPQTTNIVHKVDKETMQANESPGSQLIIFYIFSSCDYKMGDIHGNK